MKKNLFFGLMALFIANTASAVSLYPCTLDYDSDHSVFNQTKQIYLSSDRYTEVDFLNETKLDIRVDRQGNIDSFVNGQYNFLLEGNLEAATFRSANGKGSIQCSDSIEVEVAYLFRPWGQIFLNNDDFTIQNRVKADNTCYIGDAEAAAKDYQDTLKPLSLSIDSQSQALNMTFNSTRCVRDNGSSYGDYECLESVPTIKKSVVANCDYHPDDR